MEFKRLTTSGGAVYDDAMELYRSSFPFHEQREDGSQRRIMGNGEYEFYLIYEERAWVGLLLCWETADFIYVEHFCILPEMRGRGCGGKALELLHQRGKQVILEIDPPEDEVSIHRKAFYERAGYRANSFAHIHPPYHEGFQGHRLVVMSHPAALSAEEYGSFNEYLKDTVMGA